MMRSHAPEQRSSTARATSPASTAPQTASAPAPRSVSASARGQSAECVAAGWGSGGAASPSAQAAHGTGTGRGSGSGTQAPAPTPAAPQTFRARHFRLRAAGSGLNMVFMPGIAWRVPQSPVVSFTATVTTSDDAPAPANTRAGFIQTLRSSTRTGHYQNSDGQPYGTFTVSRARSMDQDTSLGPRAPWYNPTLPMTGATVDVGGRDAPWFGPPHYQDAGVGTLTRLEGEDSFCTWVAVSVDGHTPVLLGWYAWSVSWNARVDADFNVRGGGPRIGDHGEGPGHESPMLTGSPPNLGASGTFRRTGAAPG
jgi:hypothetical protein